MEADANLRRIEDNYNKIIEELKADLATARMGFDAERQALEKKKDDMAAEYER